MARKAIETERPPSASSALPGLPPHLAPGTSSATPPRKSATGGGVVVDMFRDAAQELDDLDDSEPRDAAATEVDIIDLDLDDA
jgi:hypothetical protein